MTIVTKDGGARRLIFDSKRLRNSLIEKTTGLNVDSKTLDKYISSTVEQIESQKEIDFRDINSISTKNALDYIFDIKDSNDMMDFDKLGNVDFQYIGARILLSSLYKRAAKNRSYDYKEKYGDFYGSLSSLGEQGLIEPEIFVSYTPEELKEIGEMIVPERDLLLTYSGIFNMSERYLIRAKDENRSIYELPQERYLTIALTVLRKENKEDRLKYINQLYNALSKQEITMATPTFANAGRPDAQFSSCFILTTEDSLQGIFDDNTDAARLSKAGGGIGIYMGKIRSQGSDIRGNVGAAGGTIGWLKQLNNTAVSVDQLGVRSGAIAAYQDVWHRDIEKHLELRLNTGDQKNRAHELFIGVNLPDVFVRQTIARGDWYLFDPHEIQKELGFHLEDFFDEKKLLPKEVPNEKDHAFTYHYFKAVDSNKLKMKKRIQAIDLYKSIMKSHLETGIPYMFYRDTVNRDNPNKHKGMIYSSNLCSEIAQNQSPTTLLNETIDESGLIVTYKQSGDFVTCNLSSVVLNNVLKDFESNPEESIAHLREVLRIQVRATDAVISVNNLPVLQAQYTNDRYRAIGIGEQGIAALLASLQIPFDSEQATEFISFIEERKMMFVMEASADLAQEKGSYPLFEGSEWNTGAWLDRRDLTLDGWEEVREKSMKGMRNGYLQATAPTGSTSLLAGSTASADTIFDVIFMDGKKDAKTPVVVPNLNLETWFYYKPTSLMEYEGTKDLGHMWAIKHNEARQKWIDQATSFNIYVSDDISAVNLLRLHLETWERGIKTSYYTRSESSKSDTCIACSA